MKIISAGTVVASAALLLSACGSSSTTTTTNTTGSFQSVVTQAYKYSACMRDHGATNFPDPQVSGSGNQQRIAIRAVGPNTPGLKSAAKDCQGILPAPSNADIAAAAAQRRQHTQDLLAFARCMRGRGVNGFPDPGSEGQLTLQMITNAGIDLHSPEVAAAARACVPASGGAITRADVAQATGSGG